jgi:hypothetical protein
MAPRKASSTANASASSTLHAKAARVTKPKPTTVADETKRRSTRLAMKPRKYPVRRHKNGLLNLERTPEHLIAV